MLKSFKRNARIHKQTEGNLANMMYKASVPEPYPCDWFIRSILIYLVYELYYIMVRSPCRNNARRTHYVRENLDGCKINLNKMIDAPAYFGYQRWFGIWSLVHWLFTERSLNVYWIFTEFSLNVHWMFTECTHSPPLGLWGSSSLYSSISLGYPVGTLYKPWASFDC
jgi:hypothetical protein